MKYFNYAENNITGIHDPVLNTANILLYLFQISSS